MECFECHAKMVKVDNSATMVHGHTSKKMTSISLWGDIETYVCPMCGEIRLKAAYYENLRPQTKPLFEEEKKDD